jgi:hypothetical protein
MYKFYIDGKEFTTENDDNIPWDDISSPNENTPAYEDLSTDLKIWFQKGNIHRLTGPAFILDNIKWFYLNSFCYYNDINGWLNAHPNQDETFKKEMIERWG